MKFKNAYFNKIFEYKIFFGEEAIQSNLKNDTILNRSKVIQLEFLLIKSKKFNWQLFYNR